MILMMRIITKLNPRKKALLQCHAQAGNITTNINVRIDFNLPELSVTNILMWNFDVHDSATGKYEMILSRNLLTEL